MSALAEDSKQKSLSLKPSDEPANDQDDDAPRGLTSTPIEGDEYWWNHDDAKVRRKLDLNILPIVSFAYFWAFLDRSNIGNVNTAGMTKDLHISDPDYQWLLTIFYISYICSQCGILGYKLFPASKWMSFNVTMWGCVSILQAAAFNWRSLMATRFFIGVFEGFFGAGVALYLTFFYPLHEFGLRMAWYTVGSTLASAAAGSIAYGLQLAKTATESWRLIFIVEAAPTIVMGVVIFFLLPDSIATARFLTPHERKVAEARLYRASVDIRGQQEERGNTSGNPITRFFHGKLDLENGMAAFKDPISYVSASLFFIVNVGFSSIPIYLPTILEGLGKTSIQAQAFSAPPYVGAFIVAVSVVYISDRVNIRGVFILLATCVGAIGYFILATIESNNVRYAAIWLVVIGLFTYVPLAYSWLASNSIGESKKGIALVIFSIVGQTGPLLGTRLFPASEGPYYRKGMYISGSLLLLGTLICSLSLLIIFYLNRRKDQELNRLWQVRQEKDSISYLAQLDLKLAEHKQELHRRRIDIANHREASIYYRYSL